MKSVHVDELGVDDALNNTLDGHRDSTNRAGSTSGWLSWALANGYGGRRLQDDVVDAGLTAIFGNLLDPAATVLAGLTSDNVPMSARTFSATFPYLEVPR